MFDPGIFSIGDTICTPGKKFKFGGIPTFAPEHFSRVSPKDSMKRKQFIKGTEQIAQEGAIQIFKLPNSGMEEVIVGVVGTLQFDVFQYRMKSEYGVDLRMEGLPYEYLRFIDERAGGRPQGSQPVFATRSCWRTTREEACWCSRRTGRSTTPSSAIPVSSFPRRRRTGKWVSNLGLFTKNSQIIFTGQEEILPGFFYL